MKEYEKLQPWFHNVILPDGTNTNPSMPHNPHYMLRSLEEWVSWIPGRTVLEVGCCGGAVTQWLENKGCLVDAFDSNELHVRQTKFVKEMFKLKANVWQADFTKDTFKTYDVVAYLGVLYHMADPVGMLQKAMSLAREYVLIETACVPSSVSLWEYRNWEGVYLNQFVPSLPAIHKAVEVCGGRVYGVNQFTPGRVSLIVYPR